MSVNPKREWAFSGLIGNNIRQSTSTNFSTRLPSSRKWTRKSSGSINFSSLPIFRLAILSKCWVNARLGYQTSGFIRVLRVKMSLCFVIIRTVNSKWGRREWFERFLPKSISWECTLHVDERCINWDSLATIPIQIPYRPIYITIH